MDKFIAVALYLAVGVITSVLIIVRDRKRPLPKFRDIEYVLMVPCWPVFLIVLPIYLLAMLASKLEYEEMEREERREKKEEEKK